MDCVWEEACWWGEGAGEHERAPLVVVCDLIHPSTKKTAKPRIPTPAMGTPLSQPVIYSAGPESAEEDVPFSGHGVPAPSSSNNPLSREWGEGKLDNGKHCS